MTRIDGPTAEGVFGTASVKEPTAVASHGDEDNLKRYARLVWRIWKRLRSEAIDRKSQGR